mgnify:FL=1
MANEELAELALQDIAAICSGKRQMGTVSTKTSRADLNSKQDFKIYGCFMDFEASAHA